MTAFSGMNAWIIKLSATTHLSLVVFVDCYFNLSFSWNGINQFVHLETNDWLIKWGSWGAMKYSKTKDAGKANELQELKLKKQQRLTTNSVINQSSLFRPVKILPLLWWIKQEVKTLVTQISPLKYSPFHYQDLKRYSLYCLPYVFNNDSSEKSVVIKQIPWLMLTSLFSSLVYWITYWYIKEKISVGHWKGSFEQPVKVTSILWLQVSSRVVSKDLPFCIHYYLSALCETATGVSGGGGTDGGGAGEKFGELWLTDSVETWGMTRMFS